VELNALVPRGGAAADWVRVSGYNTPPTVVPIGNSPR
jgi:hypothetical protein